MKYDAENKDGYTLSLSYDKRKKTMNIDIYDLDDDTEDTQLFPSCNIRGPKRKNKKSLRCRHLQRTEKAKPCRHEGKQPEQFFAAARACRFSAKARTLWKFLSGSVSDIKK